MLNYELTSETCDILPKHFERLYWGTEVTLDPDLKATKQMKKKMYSKVPFLGCLFV